MASVATPPNDSSDDRSGTEIDDKEEEHREEGIAEDPDFDAMVSKVSGKVPGKYLTKIAELRKK
jgi:hypothetical protein